MDNEAKRYEGRVRLGNRLRQLRIEKHFHALERFCLNNNISRNLYTGWESGKGNITYNSLLKVIEALGISVKEFFSEGFEEKK